MKLCEKFVLVFIGIGTICVAADNSDDTIAKIPQDDEVKETFRNLVRPFRMEKLNLIWVKAQQVNSRHNKNPGNLFTEMSERKLQF